MRSSLCFLCKHKQFRKSVCTAYPDGIPPRFLYGHAPHLDPAEGDHGIQFEPAEGLIPAEVWIIDTIRTEHEQRKREAAGGGKGESVRPAG